MSLPKVAFLTEAGTSRGMGHLIRCYAIYEVFKKRDYTIKFYLDSDIDFSYKFSDINNFKWDNIPSLQTYDIIFLDSYELDIDTYTDISNSVQLCIFIDDYARLDYPKGVLLNFSPNAKNIYNQKKYHTYLLGTKYLPIREEFKEYKNSKKLNQIFIMMGGMDLSNLSIKIINSIKSININKIIVTTNPNIYTKLKEIDNINILFQPTDSELAFAMASSMIAITTASMTLYELSYLSIPTIIIATSKNQEIGAKQLIDYNLAYKQIDMTSTIWKNEINQTIYRLIDSKITLNNPIDEKGIDRIIDKVLTMEFT